MGNNSNSTIGSNTLLSKLSAVRDQLFLVKRDIFDLESLYLYLTMVSPDRIINSENNKTTDSNSSSLAFFYDRNKIQDRLSSALDSRDFLEFDESTYFSMIKSLYTQAGPQGTEIINSAQMHNYIPIT